MADLGAFFGNPNLQRQVARARALAEKRDVNTLADPRTYAAVQGLLGTAPDQMGFSVLHPDYQKIRETAEPAYALGLLAQAAPVLAPLTKGLPVGASIKNVGEELIYHGTSPKAAKAIEKSGFDVTKSADGTIWFTNNPNIGEVAATGKGAVVKRFLNEKKMKLGGWDETDKYSTDELIQKGFDGLKLKDSETGEITYQIFNPEKLSVNKSYISPQQEALDTAKRNAALPVEKGGLGLPKDNTAMDRAKAMGFDIETLHGSPNPNIEAFDPMMAGGNTGNAFDNNIFATSSPESAGGYALNWKHYRNTIKTSPEFKSITREENSLLRDIGNLREAGDIEGVANVRARLEELTQQKTNIYNDFMAGKLGSEGSSIYPLMARSQDFLPYEAEGANWMRANRPAIDAAEQAGYSGALIKNVKDNAGANLGTIADVLATSDPSRFRSRFAAFDPMRTKEADILAGVLPLGLLTDEEQRKKLYELMPSLLGQ
jgi:hypothetical protein